MTIDFDKPQFAQFEASAPCATPAFFGMAMEAQIADSDFRTYVLLCQLAWQEHPTAASPWTERTYAELATLHPEHRPVSAETVRGRLNRLTRAGLITRERSGQSTWRTYPVLDGPLFPGLGTAAPPQATAQPSVPSPIHLTLHLTLDPEHAEVQVAGDRLQVAGSRRCPELVEGWQRVEGSDRVRGAHPQVSGRVPPTHPEVQGTGGQVTGRAERVAPSHPQVSGRALGTHPEAQMTGGQATGRSDRAPGTHPDPSGRALGTHPQPQMTGGQMVEEAECVSGTHPESERADGQVAGRSDRVSPTHPDPSGRARGTHPEQSVPAEMPRSGGDNPLGVYGEHTQTTLTPSGCAPGTHPDTPHTRVRARVSTDFSTDLSTDSLSVNSIQKRESDQSVLSTDQRKGQVPIKNAGVGEKHTQPPTSPEECEKPTPTAPVPLSPEQAEKDASTPTSPAKSEQDAPSPASPDKGQPPSDEKTAAAKPNHPVLDILNVLPAHEALAVTLATLAPQGMNYEGIRECLKQPRLTRAWLGYVLAQGDAIRSPAAYIRQGVRSAKPPIGATKTNTKAGNSSGPSRKPGAFERMDPNEYTLWPFDAGEWRKIDPSISDEAFQAWVETHDPETVRPKFVQ